MTPSIFISGGAAGIGKATAERFLAEGWIVGVFDISIPETTEPVINSKGSMLVRGHLDVTDPDSWDKALTEFTSHTGGGLTVLDNNAGIIGVGRLETLDPKTIKAQVDVNCLGVTYGARAAFPYLLANKANHPAHLVQMCSAASFYGQPEISVYAASKSFVWGMTESLNLEWEKNGIRVIDMCPLWAKTALADNQSTSVKRLGIHIKPEDVAEAIWDAIHPKNALARHTVHYGVSAADKIMFWARELAPHGAAKIITRILSGRG